MRSFVGPMQFKSDGKSIRESAEVPTSPVLRDLDAMMEWLTAYHVFPALVAQVRR